MDQLWVESICLNCNQEVRGLFGEFSIARCVLCALRLYVLERMVLSFPQVVLLNICQHILNHPALVELWLEEGFAGN